MMYSDSRVEEYAERQGLGSVKIHLPRGDIYDRNMREMAVSIEMASVYLNPRRVADPEKVAGVLARLLEPENARARSGVYKRLVKSIKKRKGKSFMWVRRKVPPQTQARIKSAKLPSVGFVKESKRFYPKRDTAAKIIGFCGIDNQGLSGLEYRYDKVIRPVSNRFTVLKDALGRPVSMPEALTIAREAMPFDLVLTIDERIQYIAEKALERQTLKFDAASGVAIVMNPFTGEILAIAEQPKYNPNNFAKYAADWRRLRAVSNAVEPGSTFKLFVAASALEEGVIDLDDLIDCENGRYRVAGHTFKEALNHKYKLLTLPEVIAHSSNIGAIKLAESLGPQLLRKYLTAFGFGEKAEVDLPGESPGLLRPVSEWSLTSLPSISFGQEVAVTPIQLITGVSVFANGGYLLRPHLVKAYMRADEVVRAVKPEVVRRVVSASTAMKIKKMMVNVVREGTGKQASVPGFTVAGKTGTAQKIDPETRAYSDDKFLSSFVGFFPAEEPRLAILVMIDEPKGVAWGGAVAGPVFSEIALRSARVLRIPSTNMDVYEIDWDRLTGKSAAASVYKEAAGNGI